MKNIKFYACPECGGIIQGTGKCQVICCGRPLEELKSKPLDETHSISISEVENDFYIEICHEMKKEHFISFVSYVGFDRALAVRMYPEQDPAVRIPKMFKGKFYFYCNKHGLFEYKI